MKYYIPAVIPVIPVVIRVLKTTCTHHEAGAQSARVNAIRDSIRHAWAHYKHFAWGTDELLPISGRFGKESGEH